MSQPMSLDIWAGDWGLPSVDLDCLRIMAYARFSGVPLQFRVVGSPFSSPSGKLPVFRHGQVTLTEFNVILEYLKKKNFYADLRLKEQEKSEAESYAAYLEEKLLPALLYIWWINEKNYVELTRPWYARNLRFPFNYYYPGRYERAAKQRINACFEHNPDDLVTYIYSEAEKCLNAMSSRLGDNDYYFGSLPTSLDATVFAYLAPLLRTPFPSAKLQNFLKASPNLVKFCTRIGQGYFATAFKAFETKRSEETASKQKEADEKFPHQKRNWVIAGLTATIAMTTYLFSQGMLQLSLQHDKIDNYNEIDDEDYEEIYINKKT